MIHFEIAVPSSGHLDTNAWGCFKMAPGQCDQHFMLHWHALFELRTFPASWQTLPFQYGKCTTSTQSQSKLLILINDLTSTSGYSSSYLMLKKASNIIWGGQVCLGRTVDTVSERSQLVCACVREKHVFLCASQEKRHWNIVPQIRWGLWVAIMTNKECGASH